MIAPESLSRQLRTATSPALARRRGVLGLALVASGCMALISLYQTGIISHLPEPPLPYLDADKVDAAPQAYAYLATPDAVLGLTSYSITAVLAAMGGDQRAEQQPWIPLALAAKVLVDAAAAARLTADQWTRQRAFCTWCLLAALASVSAVPLSIPEARDALRRLRRSSSTAQLIRKEFANDQASA